MNDQERTEELTPAEARVVWLLAVLRTEAPDGSALARAVLRTARWQLVVRGLARTVADLALAFANGVAVLFGLGTGSRRG
jgi:hypothetical protein